MVGLLSVGALYWFVWVALHVVCSTNFVVGLERALADYFPVYILCQFCSGNEFWPADTGISFDRVLLSFGVGVRDFFWLFPGLYFVASWGFKGSLLMEALF